MKPYIFSILCSFLSILCNPISAINDKELLIELDEVIKDQKIYEQYMEDKIKASNQKVFFTVDNPQQQFEALGELFELYRSYRTDQALSIAEQRVQLSKQLDEQSYRKAVMNKADALNKMGYYNEARELLEQMNTEKQLESDIYACYLFHTIYLSLYNEATIPQQKNTYREKMAYYTQQALEHAQPDTYSYISNYSLQLQYQGKTDEAINLLEKAYQNDKYENDKARLEYSLASLYLEKNDTIKGRHYLILSSITDLKDAKKVYMSLQTLAMLLYYQGDIERAYTYISRALEDISFGKARYRFEDIANYLPIISAGNRQHVAEEKQTSLILITFLSAVTLLLIIACFIIYTKNKRLNEAKTTLKEQCDQLRIASEHLQQMNQQIIEKDHIKEEYIGMLFNLCSEYIQKQHTLHKQLNRIATSGHLSDLSKFISEQQGKSEDLKAFIHQFDTIFLTIFPDFIKDFNALLRPEEQIKVKEGELLTPELRIYALLRLGINDNSKIASFLHYSLQTVYNYRMKMRNKTISDKKDLAVQILNIKS